MSNFEFANQTGFYRGKVRDVYSIGDNFLVMVASDRISAFDVILPRPIPFKGQVLNQIASHMLEETRDICPNWLVTTPAPTVSIGKKCVPFKLEMVVRGYLTGHAWRTYKSGKRALCGVEMVEGMNENDQFATPIITPSTKAAEGHDEDIDAITIVENGLATKDDWEKLCMLALRLFERGTQIAAKKGLILVDTKYEFGKIGDEIFLMDEVHTPDSSRYFFSEGYKERQIKGERQPQLSKEFVREWLIENSFMGKEGQVVPAMSDQWVDTISKRYIELYEKVIGKPFKPEALSQEEIFNRTNLALQQIQAG
ncbi:MAG: phosphoribosylaminoimidazolesuccinocarboxamide synthase [Bacteroidetes bacterium]|nr:phosphoribosylaminoimidazolesuccinocarboxamide synthase [Bacteroidota bacterium]